MSAPTSSPDSAASRTTADHRAALWTELTAGSRLRAQWKEWAFQAIALAAVLVGMTVLVVLIADVVIDALPRLNWKFVSSYPSRRPAEAGALSAIVGSLCLMLLTAAISVPVGIGAAIYLEEYARQNWFTRVIELNIANLAGVPSIVYGLLGLELFVRMLRLDRSLIAGALTMSALILPVIIMASREALRAVPSSLRQGSYALGATRWQTIQRTVLPLALPGMLTGIILAFSRAIGETAPLITIGALTFIAFLPDGLRSPFTVLPIQVFNWVSRPQAAFHQNAAAAIVVLLVMLLLLNAAAIWLRARFQKKLRW